MAWATAKLQLNLDGLAFTARDPAAASISKELGARLCNQARQCKGAAVACTVLVEESQLQLWHSSYDYSTGTAAVSALKRSTDEVD